jgi:hypothetical protein
MFSYCQILPLTPHCECLSDLSLIIAMNWFLCACLTLTGFVVGFPICVVGYLLVVPIGCCVDSLVLLVEFPYELLGASLCG